MQILKHETPSSEFAQIAYISFLFALRIPSETLQLIRAYKGGDLDRFSPQAERALTGLNGPKGHERLIIRFTRRKNLPQGCIVAMPCFCKLAERAAHQLCPVHFFWPLITCRVRPGAKLFSNYYDTKVNNTLKAVLRKLKIPNAERYSSHGFRRGAANELKTRGSQWSAILSLGEWRSLAFLGYVDLTPELDRDTSKLLLETDDDVESDLGGEVGLWARCPCDLA